MGNSTKILNSKNDLSVHIIVVGHVSLDTIKNESNLVENVVGGSGLYFSLSAAMGGLKVGTVSRVGHDFPQSFLNKVCHSINIEGIKRCIGSSSKYRILYENNFEVVHYDLFQPNVGNEITINDIPQYYFSECTIMHICPINPTQQMTFKKKAKEYNLLVSMDMAEFFIEHAHESVLEAVKGVDFLFCNLREARLLSKAKNEQLAAQFLHSRGVDSIIIKLGNKGVFVYNENFEKYIPTASVDKVVDPTGSGDTFAGGFISHFLKSQDLIRSCSYGNKLAGETIKGYGLSKLLENEIC